MRDRVAGARGAEQPQTAAPHAVVALLSYPPDSGVGGSSHPLSAASEDALDDDGVSGRVVAAWRSGSAASACRRRPRPPAEAAAR